MDDDKSTSVSARGLPLEKSTFKFDGFGPDAGKEIPGLDPRWVDNSRQFPRYFPLTSDYKVLTRPWIRNGEDTVEVCQWLVQLPYHKFWSQIVYGDKRLRGMIDSFLSLSPRWYDREECKTTYFSRYPEVKAVSDALYENMFFLLLRMATNKESTRAHYMSTETAGQLILEHKIFDIPRLMDICSVYAPANERLVRRIVDMVFRHQPKLYDNLKEFSEIVIKILAKIENDIERLVGRKVKILCKTIGRNDERIVNDILGYMADMLHSICLFVKFCPKALEYFHEAGLTSIIPKFVEQTIGDMLQDLYDRDLRGGFRLRLNESIGRLGHLRAELVTLWRSLLQHNVLDKLHSTKGESKDLMEQGARVVDEMLEYLMDCLNEKTFLREYADLFPLSNDIDSWVTKQIELDMDRIEYISDAVNQVMELGKSNNVAVNGQKSAADTSIPIQQTAISDFCELFPDFNAAQAFIILQHYDGNSEEAIHAVLSGNLPASCPQLPKEHAEPEPLLAAAASSSVPTGEDYAPEMVPLRESSKRGTKNVMEDKSAVNSMKSFYDRYQMETEENEWEQLVGVNPLNPMLVKPSAFDADDDEYDDTYDAHDVDLTTDMTTDEAARNQMTGGAAAKPFDKGNQPRGSEMGGRAMASSATGPSSRPYQGNYTGGKERQDKERNKSAFASHNRKELSMKKHSKGFGFY